MNNRRSLNYLLFFGKSFWKTKKQIKGQEKKQIKAIKEHGKQIAESSYEKKSLTHVR